MTEMHFADAGNHARMSGSARGLRMVNLAGAAVSVALVIGLGVWGYRLAVRDVAGVPVVRALAGPMRVAPEQPGGDVMPYQGLAVNEVAEDGASEALVERLVLAPRPVDLTAEDAPGARAAPAQATSAPPTSAQPTSAPPTSPRPATTAGLTVADPPQDTATFIDAVVTAVVEDGLAEAAGLSGTADLSGTQGLVGAQDAAAVVTPAALPGRPAGFVLRPQPRPGQSLAAGQPAPPPAPAPAVAGAAEIDPATLAVGTRLVQLGAFATADEARAEWDRLYARFGDLMRDKARVIEAAQSGGRAFFRLRAQGFAGEEDARRFCSALTSEQSSCVAVAQR